MELSNSIKGKSSHFKLLAPGFCIIKVTFLCGIFPQGAFFILLYSSPKVSKYKNIILKMYCKLSHWVFFLDFIYLFIETEGKGGRKRGRETSMCDCLLFAPYWDLAVRHDSWWGIELATLWFAGWYSIHWVTPGGAIYNVLIQLNF